MNIERTRFATKEENLVNLGVGLESARGLNLKGK